jgi:hypothetical protein
MKEGLRWLFLRALAVPDPDRRAQSCHHIKKIRKAGSDHGGIVGCDHVLDGKPHDEEAHGDAIIEMDFATITASAGFASVIPLPCWYSAAFCGR